MNFEQTVENARRAIRSISFKQWLIVGGILLLAYFFVGDEDDIFLDSRGRHTCESIIPEVVQLSKEDGPEIFEINEIEEISSWVVAVPVVQCRGIAETSKGSQNIEFGTEQSPQGTLMITLRYPHGIR